MSSLPQQGRKNIFHRRHHAAFFRCQLKLAQPHIARARPLLCALHKTVSSLFGESSSWVSSVCLSILLPPDRHCITSYILSRGYFSRATANAIEFAFRITRPNLCGLPTVIALHCWPMPNQESCHWGTCVFRMAHICSLCQLIYARNANGAVHAMWRGLTKESLRLFT